VKIDRSEAASRPHWRRFLQDLEDGHRVASPLPNRIKSLEGLIDRCRREGRPQADIDRLAAALAAAVAVPHYSTDHDDGPVLHPDATAAASVLAMLRGDGWPKDDGPVDAVTVGVLNSLIPAPPPAKTGPSPVRIRDEAAAAIARKKKKDHKGHHQFGQAVTLFTDQTGDIGVHDVTVVHFRAFVAAAESYPSWGRTTQVNQIRAVKTWLRRVRSDHDCRYGFLENPDYCFDTPAGQKIQYTLDEVRTALSHATGGVRMALLLGLNCGMYWGDIEALSPDKIDGDHIVTGRAKLTHRPKPVVGQWRLWAETRAALDFDHKIGPLEVAYTDFAKRHGLPVHKALRKTTTQVIHDHVEDAEAARLFRCEGLGGTHGDKYVRNFTPIQVARLDAALVKVASLYGIS